MSAKLANAQTVADNHHGSSSLRSALQYGRAWVLYSFIAGCSILLPLGWAKPTPSLPGCQHNLVD